MRSIDADVLDADLMIASAATIEYGERCYTELPMGIRRSLLNVIGSTYDHARRIVAEQPTIEAKPVNNSRWLYGEDGNGNDGYFCEECGEHVKWNYKTDDINFIKKYEYCPYCGRKMDRKEE